MENIIENMEAILTEVIGVPEEVVHVVTAINGRNEETMCDILYVYTGLRDFDQMDEEE